MKKMDPCLVRSPLDSVVDYVLIMLSGYTRHLTYL